MLDSKLLKKFKNHSSLLVERFEVIILSITMVYSDWNKFANRLLFIYKSIKSSKL